MRLRFSYHDGSPGSARSLRVDIAGPGTEALVPLINTVGWQRTQHLTSSLEALDLLCERMDTEQGVGASLAQMREWSKERPESAWFMIWRVGPFGLKLPYLGERKARLRESEG